MAAKEPRRVLQCHAARTESPPPLAGTGVRLLANHPEMSKKGVAQLFPFSGYRHSANIGTLKSGFAEPLFRGVQRRLAAFPALLEVDNSALQPDHGGVCPVVRAEHGE